MARLLLAVISVLVSLILLEILAGAWLTRFAGEAQFRRYASLVQIKARYETGEGPVLKYVPHRYIGYVPAAGFRGRWVGVYHNALGFRSREISLEKAEGEFRIVALGGSTTYTVYSKPEDLAGAGVFAERLASGRIDPDDPRIAKVLRAMGMPDLETLLYANAYPGYLELELRRRGQGDVRVINAGAEGYTTWESLLNFQLRCLDLDPDLVLVYHGFNDIHGRLVWPPEAYRGDNSANISHSSGWYQPLPLHLRSTALRILLVALGRARSPTDLVLTFATVEPTTKFWDYKAQLRKGRYPSGFFRQHSVAELLEQNGPVYFRRNIENIVVTARQHGVQPVLMTLAFSDADPTNVLNTPEYNAALREHNAVVREIAGDLGTPLIDLAREFPEGPDVFIDTVHMTSEGGRIMAGLIADSLAAAGLLP